MSGYDKETIEALSRGLCISKGIDPDGFQSVYYQSYYAKPREHNGRGRSEMIKGTLRNWEAHEPLAYKHLQISQREA